MKCSLVMSRVGYSATSGGTRPTSTSSPFAAFAPETCPAPAASLMSKSDPSSASLNSATGVPLCFRFSNRSVRNSFGSSGLTTINDAVMLSKSAPSLCFSKYACVSSTGSTPPGGLPFRAANAQKATKSMSRSGSVSVVWNTARLIFAVSSPHVPKSISRSSSWRFSTAKERETPELSPASVTPSLPAVTKSHTSRRRASWYTARGGGSGFAAMARARAGGETPASSRASPLTFATQASAGVPRDLRRSVCARARPKGGSSLTLTNDSNRKRPGGDISRKARVTVA
mmetsp:Transcript_5856/g.23703  ORF Transcript_5856/g.23703 Transcript_5856/m.23703 type:complete len:286 (-) Transcript_5856:1453-2310(-)